MGKWNDISSERFVFDQAFSSKDTFYRLQQNAKSLPTLSEQMVKFYRDSMTSSDVTLFTLVSKKIICVCCSDMHIPNK